jgi:hypothetical protein
MPELLPKSIPSISIVTVYSEIAALSEKVIKKWNIEVHPSSPTNIFSLSEMSSFPGVWGEVSDILAKASGNSFNGSDITEEILQETYLILHNYFCRCAKPIGSK